MSSTQAAVTLRMESHNQEAEFPIRHRGRAMEVTFLPDEDGCTPSEPSEFPVSEEQAQGWARGEWWYHHVLVRAVDDQGDLLELGSIPTSQSYGRLPSFMDHTGLVFRICDQLCDDLDAHGIPTTTRE